MNTILQNIIWLESWETKKEHNVELGFNNHSMLRGTISENIFSDLEQLPNIDFFLKLSKLKPKLYAENEVIYGELICYVANIKYRVIYHYDTNCYMVTDDNDTIIKKIGSNA